MPVTDKHNNLQPKNVSKTHAKIGWAKISCYRIRFLDRDRLTLLTERHRAPCGRQMAVSARKQSRSLPRGLSGSCPVQPASPVLGGKREHFFPDKPLFTLFFCSHILPVLTYKYPHTHIYIGITLLVSKRYFILSILFQIFFLAWILTTTGSVMGWIVLCQKTF